MVNNILELREIPDALLFKNGKPVKTIADFEKRREEIKKILTEEEYGEIPERPEHLSFRISDANIGFCAGKAPLIRYTLTCHFGEEKFSFPLTSIIPRSDNPIPAFIYISHTDNAPNEFLPSEEIADRGFAVFSFSYKDISSNDGNFRDKLGKHLCKTRRQKNAPGKLAIWAWAAMRVLDFVETLDSIDKESIAIVGHSVLGRAALLAGGFDERFKFVISNNSGCGGAALTRGKTGESFASMGNSSHLFCPRWLKNSNSFSSRLYDQNFLCTLVVPRHLMVGSADDDTKSDPTSEFLCAASANAAYELYGTRGIVFNGEIPNAPCVLDEGSAHYHVRDGIEYFSRNDWNAYMNYIDKISSKRSN